MYDSLQIHIFTINIENYLYKGGNDSCYTKIFSSMEGAVHNIIAPRCGRTHSAWCPAYSDYCQTLSVWPTGRFDCMPLPDRWCTAIRGEYIRGHPFPEEAVPGQKDGKCAIRTFHAAGNVLQQCAVGS
jgi:hypothetical protein